MLEISNLIAGICCLVAAGVGVQQNVGFGIIAINVIVGVVNLAIGIVP